MKLTVILGGLLVAALLATVLRQYKTEYALMVGILAGAVALLAVIFHVSDGLYELLNTALGFGMDGSYFTVAFKALGICIITGFIADLCRDSGQTALASRAELAGRCAVFILSLPLLTSILETAKRIIN
jgi:stage III sporulation protein AD